MLKITDNGVITINRGDYATIPLFINGNNEDRFEPLRYKLRKNDKVYLSVMTANTPFEAGEIRKIYTKDNLNIYGDVVITFESSDTENLLPGLYYYEIKIAIFKDNNYFIETLVPRKRFYII